MVQRDFKTDALVLAGRPLGEADKIITLLTWEDGKLDAVARGARKTKSRLAAGVDIFTYGHYLLHRGRNLAIITGQEVKEHFFFFRDNPDLYPYGLYLGELTGKLISGAERCPAVCEMLLTGWRLLGESLDNDLLCRAFELKMASITGHTPFLDGCLDCGAEKDLLFSPVQGGFICRSCCAGSGAFAVEKGTAALAERLLKSPLDQVRMLRAGPAQKEELARLTGAFLCYHLDTGELCSGSTRALMGDMDGDQTT